jgi:serine/threonine protein kinase
MVHGRRVDIWAVGVTIYYMATKTFPIGGKDVMQFSQNLTEGEIDFNLIRQKDPGSEALNLLIRFLKKLLTKDPLERATVQELVNDLWLTNKGTEPIEVFLTADTLKTESSL